MADKVVFEENPDGTYDLYRAGRIVEYDVEADDMTGALRRARIDPRQVWIEDITGYRTKMLR